VCQCSIKNYCTVGVGTTSYSTYGDRPSVQTAVLNIRLVNNTTASDTVKKQNSTCPYLRKMLTDFQYEIIFSARCNIYISRLCYDVSVRLSVRLSVTEVHWRIIANLGFKFRSTFTAHCGRGEG